MSRAPNFTVQGCMLLAQLMGEEHKDLGLSRHKVDKHRFNCKITSSTKKELWQGIEKCFNCNSTVCKRSASELQKKWKNLVSKGRAIYSDHQRTINLTGRGPVNSKYSILTEAVIDVIGRDSISITGASDFRLDSTFSQLEHSQNAEDSGRQESSNGSEVRIQTVHTKSTGKARHEQR